MSGARDAILGGIRKSLGRATPTAPVHPAPAPVPARGQPRCGRPHAAVSGACGVRIRDRDSCSRCVGAAVRHRRLLGGPKTCRRRCSPRTIPILTKFLGTKGRRSISNAARPTNMTALWSPARARPSRKPAPWSWAGPATIRTSRTFCRRLPSWCSMPTVSPALSRSFGRT